MSRNNERDETLRLYREYELGLITKYIPASSRILEIGAGRGWQAKLLRDLGYSVEALELTTSRPCDDYSYPVKLYDGHNIPFADKTFDIVYSSNVLEHIAHIEDFEGEIWRVLKDDGRAIHILPTTPWRLWTSITHHLYVLRSAINLLLSHKAENTTNIKRKKIPIIYALWPNRHGERGNSLTELYYFSRCSWSRHFKNTGWSIDEYRGTGLFYTGNQILHRHLKLSSRKSLSRILGSVTQIFVLHKDAPISYKITP